MEYHYQTRKEILAETNKVTNQLIVSTGTANKISNLMQKLMPQIKAQSRKLSGPSIQNVKQIRASVITHWIKTHNLREVQYKAGHRYLSSTEAYLVNDIESLQEDITKYHPIG